MFVRNIHIYWIRKYEYIRQYSEKDIFYAMTLGIVCLGNAHMRMTISRLLN